MTRQEAAPDARQLDDIRKALKTLGYISVPTSAKCDCEMFRRPEAPNHPVVIHRCPTWASESEGGRRQGVIEVFD